MLLCGPPQPPSSSLPLAAIREAPLLPSHSAPQGAFAPLLISISFHHGGALACHSACPTGGSCPLHLSFALADTIEVLLLPSHSADCPSPTSFHSSPPLASIIEALLLATQCAPHRVLTPLNHLPPLPSIGFHHGGTFACHICLLSVCPTGPITLSQTPLPCPRPPPFLHSIGFHHGDALACHTLLLPPTQPPHLSLPVTAIMEALLLSSHSAP